jgi:hypothetical protein
MAGFLLLFEAQQCLSFSGAAPTVQVPEPLDGVHCRGSGRLFDRYDGSAFGTSVLDSPDRTDPYLLARLNLGLRPRRQLQNTGRLAFGQQREQHDAPIRKLKRIMMCRPGHFRAAHHSPAES